MPFRFNAPLPETITVAVPPYAFGPIIDPVRIKVPELENATLPVVGVEAVCAIAAATLADDPTPRLGVVMQLVAVAP